MHSLARLHLVIGDFNIYLNKANDPLSKAFLALIDTSGFTQFVHEPTHSSGNTLDLILSRGIEVSALNVSSVSFFVSDNFLIKSVLTLACTTAYSPGSFHDSDRAC